jgi:ferredoxin
MPSRFYQAGGPEDGEKFDGESGKLEKYFSEAPGEGD